MKNLVRGAAALALTLVMGTQAVAITPDKLSHIHGMAELKGIPYLAGHDGLYRYDPKLNDARRVSADAWDFMSLAYTPEALLGSGHPPEGGNLGLVRSTDGVRWTRVSPGLNGPVDFHMMAVDPRNSRIIYGLYGSLQRSADGGQTWEKAGKLPSEKTYSLALQVTGDKERLMAGVDQGLLVSEDQGRTWRPGMMLRLPVTLVSVTSDGVVWAFVVGKGLMRAEPDTLRFRPVFNALGTRYPRYLVRAGEGYQLLDNTGMLWTGDATGTNWTLNRGAVAMGPAEASGKKLFDQYCTACHGSNGVGETYSVQALTDQNYRMAPALDWTMHAWHHTDENLRETILNGFPDVPGSRMPAGKGTLSAGQADDIIAYMKTLWRERERNCQGPKHMNCQE